MSRPTHLVVDAVARVLLGMTGWTSSDILAQIETQDMEAGWMRLAACHLDPPLTFDVVPARHGHVVGNAWRTIGRLCVHTSGWMVNAQMDETPLVQIADCVLPASILESAVGRRVRDVVDLPPAFSALGDVPVLRAHQQARTVSSAPCVELAIRCDDALIHLGDSS
jgi:hypothetical protein